MWPVFFESNFISHANILLATKAVDDTISANITIRGKIIHNFKTCKSKKETVRECVNKIKIMAEKPGSGTAEIIGAVLLIQAYFGEEELFQINAVNISFMY